MKKMYIVGVIISLAAIGVGACSALPVFDQIFPSSATQTTLETTVPQTIEPSPTPTEIPRNITSLTIWIPPQFQPQEGSTAGNLFLSQLDGYSTRRPQIDMQVRVKELEGQYGMLSALRYARDAAPLVMPDIVALPRPLAEIAYGEELIIPLDDRTELMEDNNWFDYARDLSLLNEQIIGIPFAGDALVMAYKSDNGEDPPTDWSSLIEFQKPLAFPASDPQSLVTLAYYESLGGEFVDVDGKVQLQEEPFLEVLEFYQEAQGANVMPYWLTQFENEQQSWVSYQERQSTLAITWSSQYFEIEAPTTSLAALPTQTEKPFSYVTGWVWCVISSDPTQEQESIELVEYLVEESYLNAWTAESGFLPTRPTTLESWPKEAFPVLWQQVLPPAVLLPNQTILDTLGPPVKDAVVSVLKDQVAPQIAWENYFGGE